MSYHPWTFKYGDLVSAERADPDRYNTPRQRAHEARGRKTWNRRERIAAEINDGAAWTSPLAWALQCFEMHANEEPVRLADFQQFDNNGTHWHTTLTPKGRAWLRRARNETPLLEWLREADREDYKSG